MLMQFLAGHKNGFWYTCFSSFAWVKDNIVFVAVKLNFNTVIMISNNQETILSSFTRLKRS
jgi:hypothetical protein